MTGRVTGKHDAQAEQDAEVIVCVRFQRVEDMDVE